MARHTAQRILDTTLDLFNRFGEPNVSTTLISAELGISPGNLYYHFPAKDQLINRLYEAYEAQVNPVLSAASDIANVEDAWFFMHSLFEAMWAHRFLYRDLSDLLSKNRFLETHVQLMLQRKRRAMQALLRGVGAHLHAQLDEGALETAATSMVVVSSYWLSYEYVCNPRRPVDEAHSQAALMRGAHHALSTLLPYLAPEQRAHLNALASAYLDADADPLHPS